MPVVSLSAAFRGEGTIFMFFKTPAPPLLLKRILDR